jgi:hypothetical protein
VCVCVRSPQRAMLIPVLLIQSGSFCPRRNEGSPCGSKCVCVCVCSRFCGTCRFVTKFVCVPYSSCHECRNSVACLACRDPCLSWRCCVYLRVMHVPCHACRVSGVSRLLRSMHVTCRTCLDWLRSGSCTCQNYASLPFVFVAHPCIQLRTTRTRNTEHDFPVWGFPITSHEGKAHGGPSARRIARCDVFNM